MMCTYSLKLATYGISPARMGCWFVGLIDIDDYENNSFIELALTNLGTNTGSRMVPIFLIDSTMVVIRPMLCLCSNGSELQRFVGKNEERWLIVGYLPSGVTS
ncbi:hypothetical protein M0802_013243 [Mischocyttarus mexicanus]|nr:hypothetical protein M0802_013243 [Mischocyttarus mexicanus]